MRILSLVLFSFVSLYASELIYISNDISQENLDNLEKKYKQSLLLNAEKVYLIPSDCRLDRYFGGASNGQLILSQRPEQTKTIIITQEIFEAKETKDIIEKIEVEKSIALVEGKISKDFLDDKDGRGFGGASQVPLDFTFQKTQANKIYMAPVSSVKIVKEKAEPYKHPSCKLLSDGSGYELINTVDASFYSNTKKTSISKTTILFR